jgi:hypothetical protein
MKDMVQALAVMVGAFQALFLLCLVIGTIATGGKPNQVATTTTLCGSVLASGVLYAAKVLAED